MNDIKECLIFHYLKIKILTDTFVVLINFSTFAVRNNLPGFLRDKM